jgi:hypothetical protein
MGFLNLIKLFILSYMNTRFEPIITVIYVRFYISWIRRKRDIKSASSGQNLQAF